MRSHDTIRPLTFQRHFTRAAAGSVLVTAGETVVLCTASVSTELPKWLPAGTTRGWLSAEYRMLPGSTSPRSPRSDRPDGRATEIQRLIGRSLRAVLDVNALGPRMIHIDCDVIQADGGTRTTSINGSYVALVDALLTLFPEGSLPLTDAVAAISVGIVDGVLRLDLDYAADAAADVDMNVVMTGSGRFVEVQASGEEATFSPEELTQLLALARCGIDEVLLKQRESAAH